MIINDRYGVLQAFSLTMTKWKDSSCKGSRFNWANLFSTEFLFEWCYRTMKANYGAKVDDILRMF